VLLKHAVGIAFGAAGQHVFAWRQIVESEAAFGSAGGANPAASIGRGADKNVGFRQRHARHSIHHRSRDFELALPGGLIFSGLICRGLRSCGRGPNRREQSERPHYA